MGITVEKYLTYRPEPGTDEYAAWIVRVIETAGPDIWAHADATDGAVAEVVAQQMGTNHRGRAIVTFAARHALRAALGQRNYWLLGWPESWLPPDADTEYWQLWEQATRIIDDVICAAYSGRIWERRR